MRSRLGFRKVDRQNVFRRYRPPHPDIALQIGATSDTMLVTDEAPVIRTQDAQQGEVVTSTFIRNLPQLQRDPLRLLTIAGNVQGSGDRAQPGSDTRINGGRTVGVEYLVDGITAGTGLGHEVIRNTPTMEMVAEFKVISNGISAEYGRLSGGAVELITRSGTNSLHGELFDYFQNDLLNASSWAQNAQGGTKIKFRQNIFGGWLGGPVRVPKLYNGTNRTFFTFNYQGTRRSEAGALVTLSVPTELERRGDFSQTCSTESHLLCMTRTALWFTTRPRTATPVPSCWGMANASLIIASIRLVKLFRAGTAAKPIPTPRDQHRKLCRSPLLQELGRPVGIPLDHQFDSHRSFARFLSG
ncbi:MAG: Plug domain-containing protein [Bryobacteraceae bacterium]